MVTKKHSLQQTIMFRKHCWVTRRLMWQRVSPTSSDTLCENQAGWKKRLWLWVSGIHVFLTKLFLSGLTSHSPWCFTLSTFNSFPVNKPAFAGRIFCFFFTLLNRKSPATPWDICLGILLKTLLEAFKGSFQNYNEIPWHFRFFFFQFDAFFLDYLHMMLHLRNWFSLCFFHPQLSHVYQSVSFFVVL